MPRCSGASCSYLLIGLDPGVAPVVTLERCTVVVAGVAVCDWKDAWQMALPDGISDALWFLPSMLRYILFHQCVHSEV